MKRNLQGTHGFVSRYLFSIGIGILLITAAMLILSPRPERYTRTSDANNEAAGGKNAAAVHKIPKNAPKNELDGIAGDWKATLERSLGDMGESEQATNTANTATNTAGENTLTGNFLDALLAEFLKEKALAPKGTYVDPKSAIRAVLAKEQPNETTTEISENAISVSNDNSEAAINAYFSTVKSILKDLAKAAAAKEQRALLHFVQTEDPETLKRLAEVRAEYEKALSALLALRVPSTLKDTHTEGANLLLGFIGDFKALENFSNDPLKGALAFGNYFKRQRQSESLLAELQPYIDASP